MNDIHLTISKRAARAGVGVAASLLLVGGVAWRGFAQSTPPAHAATVTTPLTRAVEGGRDSYADVVDVVAPAVVTIRTEGKATMAPAQFQAPDEDWFQQFFGMPFGQGRQPNAPPRTFKQHALGSGVMVTSDGYILTNNHVVDGADKIRVEFSNGESLDAKVVGTDKPTDLALLKIEGSDFNALALGNSDAVKVGDVVLAVGNPLGIGETVTMGIISAKGRSTGNADGSYEDFLQTDAPINHGNSGGALVNTRGELIGINSQILTGSQFTQGNIGIGFAIPVNMAKNVMEQLRTKGKVTRAQLGVTIQNVSPEMAQSLGLEQQTGGVIVSSVLPDSAADHAGLKQGDVITALDGKAVKDMNGLRNRVAQSTPGSNADLTIVRSGHEQHLSVKLDELNPEQTTRNGPSESGNDGTSDKGLLGVAVEPLTPALAQRLGVKSTHGLVVDEVNPDSRAADAQIQQGDVIESVNRQDVSSVDELRAALGKTPNRPALLLLNRNGNEIFVTVRPASE